MTLWSATWEKTWRPRFGRRLVWPAWVRPQLWRRTPLLSHHCRCHHHVPFTTTVLLDVRNCRGRRAFLVDCGPAKVAEVRFVGGVQGAPPLSKAMDASLATHESTTPKAAEVYVIEEVITDIEATNTAGRAVSIAPASVVSLTGWLTWRCSVPMHKRSSHPRHLCGRLRRNGCGHARAWDADCHDLDAHGAVTAVHAACVSRDQRTRQALGHAAACSRACRLGGSTRRFSVSSSLSTAGGGTEVGKER